jgi:hypothetical protein
VAPKRIQRQNVRAKTYPAPKRAAPKQAAPKRARQNVANPKQTGIIIL